MLLEVAQIEFLEPKRVNRGHPAANRTLKSAPLTLALADGAFALLERTEIDLRDVALPNPSDASTDAALPTIVLARPSAQRARLILEQA